VIRHLLGPLLSLFLVPCFPTACDSGTEVKESPALIVTDFEGASLGSAVRRNESTFHLNLRGDTNSGSMRWYSFRIQGDERGLFSFRILNAGDASASSAWAFDRPLVSVNGGSTWERIADTDYDGQVFTFWYAPRTGSDWVAYQPVYNFSRWEAWLGQHQDDAAVDSVRVIGTTLGGRPVHLVKITDRSVPDTEKTAVWVIARQHASEVGGSWAAEGLLQWLVGTDPQAAELRRRAVFYMIPFMNPDGVALGNYRTNGAGRDINREWLARNPSTAPSVAAAATEMEGFVAGGGTVTLFADFHSASSSRKNYFIYNGAEGTSPEEAAEISTFMELYEALNPDFTVGGSVVGLVDARRARRWAYESLGTHAITFETAYQDVQYGPRMSEYMTTDRFMELGADFGRAVAEFFFSVGP